MTPWTPGRRLLILGVLALAPPARRAGAQPAVWQPWFDPQHLPRFTGMLDRYLPAPDGGVDGFLFREGAQVLFPRDLAETLMAELPEGRVAVVHGIRARNAPAITLLAWAPAEDTEPRWVERPTWPRPPSWQEMRETMQVEGTVRTPLYAANGVVNGALLDDGSVIRLPGPPSARTAERLKRGARVAAEGPGTAATGSKSLLAQRLGERLDSLAPLEPPG